MTRVLIVDDSLTIRRMVKASLAPLPGPLDFIEATSGLEAIERLAFGTVDLIVLDLNMPDMHGLEVLGLLRSHQKYRSFQSSCSPLISTIARALEPES